MTIYGRDGGDRAGWTVAACNLNNDSYDDIVIGAPDGYGEKNSIIKCGELYVIYGNKTEQLPATWDLLHTPANITINGTTMHENVGRFAITSGDVNGDKAKDLIFGSKSSRTYIFYGNSSFQSNFNISALNASVVIYSGGSWDYFGYTLSTGNINNDTYDDLMIGAYGTNGPNDNRMGCGEAYVINGSRSLPSKIDFRTQEPNITIYGAEYADSAGTAVLMCDNNGDGLDDLIIGTPNADGRLNGKEKSGEVYIILLTGETLPVPYTDTLSLVNGASNDGMTCYAQLEPYGFELRIRTPNEPDELESVMLHLGYYTSANNIKFGWSRLTGKFSEINDPNNYTIIDSSSNYNEYKKIWTINFYIVFNWNYPNNNYQSVQVRTTGSTGLTDWLNLSTRHIYKVENRLNFTGDLEVISESQGELVEGDWVRGGEKITWKGLKIIYFESMNLYPLANSGIEISVNDPDGNSWTKLHKPGLIFSINTYAVNKTLNDKSYSINIIGIPVYCDKSDINFKLNIDHDKVIFTNSYPDINSWQATLQPSCRIRILDLSTDVDNASIHYRYSNDNGETWTNWVNNNIVQIPYKKGINCTVKPTFSDGKNNLIQWRAKDIVGNDYSESPEYRILVDVTHVTFTDPTPSSDIFQINESVECGISIKDELSGVNASSIEFSTSTSGIWGYGDWQSAKQFNNSNIINCSVTPTFVEGTDNYIRWRAMDIAGNGYHISEDCQIKIKLNKPPTTTLISPKNNSIIYTLFPELVWKTDDPDNDTSLFHSIYLSKDKEQIISQNNTTLLKTNIVNQYFELDIQLEDEQNYYWTIIPSDGKTTGSCTSGIWEFKVLTTIDIPITTLVEPLNNTNITTTTPELSWILNYFNPTNITYNIYLAKSPISGDLISDKNLHQEDYKLTTFIIDKPLIRGEIYHWTVIPIAEHPAGILEGICRSGKWSFKVELPEEYNYNLSMEIETEILSVEQGGYVTTNITITNLGEVEDSISIEINKGILNANIAFRDSINQIVLSSGEYRRITLEIMISPIAAPKNYTIYVIATSENAPEELDVSVTKAIQLEILEKEPDDETEKEPIQQFGVWDLITWLVLILIIFILITFSIFYYKAKKAREIPTLRAELMSKPPDHLALSGGETIVEDERMLAGTEGGGLPSLGAPGAPTQYQLPKAVLTKAQELKLLREKFLLGEIDKDIYKEMKAEIESYEDISDMELDEQDEIELKGKLPSESLEDELSSVEEAELKDQEEMVPSEIEDLEDIEPDEIPSEVDELIRSELDETENVKDIPLEEQVAEDEFHDTQEEVHPFPRDGLCISCGESLDPDMAFCWSCGTKYEKKDVEE
jgi:hypothetical protein